MITIGPDDLQSFVRRPVEPTPAPEHATKAAASDFTVRRMAHHEEWSRAPDAQRSTKAVALAKGAKSESESRILNAVRKAPVASIPALARTCRMPEITTQLAWQSLMHRNLVKEVAGMLGTLTLAAVD